jgi:hypothetical protein
VIMMIDGTSLNGYARLDSLRCNQLFVLVSVLFSELHISFVVSVWQRA